MQVLMFGYEQDGEAFILAHSSLIRPIGSRLLVGAEGNKQEFDSLVDFLIINRRRFKVDELARKAQEKIGNLRVVIAGEHEGRITLFEVDKIEVEEVVQKGKRQIDPGHRDLVTTQLIESALYGNHAVAVAKTLADRTGLPNATWALPLKGGVFCCSSKE